MDYAFCSRYLYITGHLLQDRIQIAHFLNILVILALRVGITAHFF